MIRFIVQHHRGSTIVREVEVAEVFSYPWQIRPGEKRYVILSDSMKEDSGDYPIWYSFFTYDSEALALNAATNDLRNSTKIFNEGEIATKIAAITVKKLEKKNGEIK